MDKNRFLVIKSKVLFSTINAKKSRSALDFSLENKKIIISTQNDKKINPKGYTSTLVKKIESSLLRPKKTKHELQKSEIDFYQKFEVQHFDSK